VPLRRLLVIYRHRRPTSAMARVLGEDWTRADSQSDDIRRGIWALLTRKDQPMHPDRPLARLKAAERKAKAERSAARRAASDRREAARQARLRAQGGDR
jgi:hypothetical protein